MASTMITKHINAPREKIYEALISPDAIKQWKFPDDMTIQIHEFESREGGKIHVSLSYNDHSKSGKTSGHTDTYHGYFEELVPPEKVVEIDQFEAADGSLGDKMTITITLAEAEGGTVVTALHEGLPDGLPVADNETGWRMALTKLAAFVEKAD